jgi:peroxiredoxin Q/BCP
MQERCSMSRKIVTVLAGAGGALLVLALTYFPVATGQDKTAPGQKDKGWYDWPALKSGEDAPPFTAETTDGKRIALADYRGKSAVLLVFFSPGSDGGEGTLRYLQTIHDKYHKKGLQVLVVPTEKKRDDAAGLSNHLKVGFSTVFDPNCKLAEAYKVPPDLRGFLLYPMSVVIGRDGKVAASGLMFEADTISSKTEVSLKTAVLRRSRLEDRDITVTDVHLEKAVQELTEKK